MRTVKYLYIVLILWGCGFANAQVTFEVKASKTSLGANERLRIDFQMNQDGDNFRAPDFNGFRATGPNTSISNSYFNGKRSYSKTYTYFLSPQKKGKITIGSASIEIQGKTYTTKPIDIAVTAAVAVPKDENNPDYVAGENVHLVAEVSNANPYLNEGITVVYKLYVSNQVSITSNWREINTPKYADFWSQNIDSRGNYKIYEGKYKGEDYRYVILRRTVLYPQKIGELEIEPLTLDIPIDVKTNRKDRFFGRVITARVNKTISAGKRKINVKPLPEEGKPLNYTGAVGDFKFDVSTSKLQLDANQSFELSLRVIGNGNLKLFDLPKLKLPSSLEVYEPTRNDDIRTQGNGMSGAMIEKYTVVPQYKGTYPIRPINFSFFNPKTESYVNLASQEIIVDVLNGPINAETTSNDNNAQGSKQTIDPKKDQFKSIKLDANLEPIAKEHFFKSNLFWMLLATPFAIIPLFILVGYKREQRLADVQGNKLRKATRMAKKYLSEAKKKTGDKVAFYEAMERALHNYLKAKLSIETSEMDKNYVGQLLQERKVDTQVVEDFKDLLQRCDFARYTPTSAVTIQQDYDTAVQTISTIDKQFQ